ncbi:PglL family O-oligosaccharyltransferase [Vibrio sp. WXL103]|uniref:PglL family O-oligosaccharyltransferase n=1 Tax=unclassified Vibrio TaxID=2614977 RepID=UPI003EC5C701
MATIHVSGTQLQPAKPVIPLNRPFIMALSAMFLLFMHVFMPNPGGSGLALIFNNTTWAGLSLAIGVGLYQISINHYLRYNKFTIGLLIACGLMTLPMLYSAADISTVAPRILALWSGWVFFVALQQFRLGNKHKQRILELIVIASVIEALIGYGQYFWLEPGNQFGYNAVDNRPYGIFQQANVMASFLATGLVLSGYLLARKNNRYSTLLDTGLHYIAPLLLTPLLVVLASRTGWISSLVAVMMIMPYLWRFSTKRRALTWLAMVVIGTGLGFVASQHQHKTEFIAQKVTLTDVRQDIYSQAMDMMIEKPFTGWGYGRFESQYTLYTARQHQINHKYQPGLPAMDHPHNEILLWGIEGGIVPLLGLLLVALLTVARIRQAKPGTRLALLALFVPILLHSQLEYPFYHSAIHWLVLIILLYWVDQRTSKLRHAHFSPLIKAGLRVSCLVVPLTTVTYMVSAMHTNHVLTQFEQSSPKDPKILERISNPYAWTERYQWAIYSTYFDIGLQTGDHGYTQVYVNWSLDMIKRKPRPELYKNLILAYSAMGDERKAKQVRTEAELLYPRLAFPAQSRTAPIRASVIDPELQP